MYPYLLLISILLAVAAGCQNGDNGQFSFFKKTPKRILTIHTLSPSGSLADTAFAQKIQRADGQAFYIRSLPVLSPDAFRSVAARTDSRQNALEITLNSHGRLVWYQACVDFRGSNVAVLIDGDFVQLLPKPFLKETTTELTIPLSWEEERILKLAKGIRNTIAD